MRYTTWETISGKVIMIKDMSDRHLINTIKMLQRNWELAYQHACDHNDDGMTIASASDCMPSPSYEWFKPAKLDDLMAIAKGRGIKI